MKLSKKDGGMSRWRSRIKVREVRECYFVGISDSFLLLRGTKFFNNKCTVQFLWGKGIVIYANTLNDLKENH